MATIGEIYVVTSSGTGHLLTCIQLCNHLSSANYTPTLVTPSTVSADHLPAIMKITAHAIIGTDAQMGNELEAHLFARSNGPESAHPACAIVSSKWAGRSIYSGCSRFRSSASLPSARVQLLWSVVLGSPVLAALTQPQVRCTLFPAYQKTSILHIMILRESLYNKLHAPLAEAPWVPLVGGSVALIFNTCADLERPFINYLATELGLPVLGVGPLLPNQYWALSNSMIHDVLIRSPRNQSNFIEDQILQWLNKNPEKSVLYVSFGSEVSPTVEESMQLASALEEMPYPFIWVIRSISNNKSRSKHPMDLANNALSNVIKDVEEQRNEWDFLDELTVRIQGRGLIINGWAPQLLILSHPSTGGFLSHCGYIVDGIRPWRV